MTRVESERRAKCRLPAWRPLFATCHVGCGVQPETSNHRERVTVPRIDRDPFSATFLTKITKLRGTHWRFDHAGAAKSIRNRARAIISRIEKRFVTAAVPIRFGAKLIGRPDRSFHCERRMFRRSRTAETKTRCASRNYWSGIRKGIGRCRWDDHCQDRDAQGNLTTNRIDKRLRGALYRRKAAVGKKKFQKFLANVEMGPPVRCPQRTLACDAEKMR